MDPRRRRPAPAAPRVVVAMVVLALVAGCTVRLRPDPAAEPGTATAPATTAPAPAPATRRGTTLAAHAFILQRDGAGGPVRPAPPGPLPVALRRGPGTHDESTNTLLVFPLLPAPPRCVRQVELWLRVCSFDHPRAVIAAYPSRLVSLATGEPAKEVGDETLVDNRPRGTGRLTAGGAWLRFDITGLYRTWARGGPFPSRLRTIEPGRPLVLDVRPEAFAEPYFQARFAPLGGDRRLAPQLHWRVLRRC